MPPGETLRAELSARRITQKEFAKLIGIQLTHLREILNGKRDINLTIAIKLERQLGIPAEFWIRLQEEFKFDRIAIGIASHVGKI